MSIVYREEDGDLNLLTRKNIGVIGYGNLGRPVALNLRDLNLNIVVGVRSEESRMRALADGIAVAPIEDIVRDAHILLMLVSDDVIGQVYLEKISPHLSRGQALIFTSGYSVAFGFIEPPSFIDVGLIAPRTIGQAVRDRFLSREGYYSFVAVGQDATGKIWDTVLAVAKAIGALRKGAIEISIEQEAELDLFVQQAIVPSIHHILSAAVRLLLETGYPPEVALTDLYLSGEFSEIMQRAADRGLLESIKTLSLTNQYGALSRMERFAELKPERLMEVTLEEIQGGVFAKEWAQEYADGYPRLQKLKQQYEGQDLWEIEQQTIQMLRDDFTFDPHENGA